jgi:hypothetical protein
LFKVVKRKKVYAADAAFDLNVLGGVNCKSCSWRAEKGVEKSNNYV